MQSDRQNDRQNDRRGAERRLRDAPVDLDRRHQLRRKIEASERIVSGDTTDPCSDPIVERMIAASLAQKLPALRQELVELEKMLAI